MSHADWTPSPVVEREAALVRRRWRFGELNVLGAGLATFGAMASLIGGLKALARLDFAGLAFVALAFALGALVLFLHRRDNARLEAVREPDRVRRTEFGSNDGWLVDLLVLQGDAPTGRDRGILWIEGDRLHFAGDRTSFSLAPADIAGPCRKESPIRGLRLGSKLPLRHETAGGRIALSIEVQNALTDRLNGLDHAVDTFARRKTVGSGQLPPTTLGPGASSKLALFVWASSLTGIVLFSAGFCILAAFAAPNALNALIVLSLVFCGIWSTGAWTISARWRAWRDRRRLER